MAGKILSDVNGESDTYAATANELNATSTGNALISTIPLQGLKFTHMAHRSKANCSRTKVGMLPHIQQTRNRDELTLTIPIFLSIFSSWSFLTLETQRVNAFSQAYSLMLSRYVSRKRLA